MNNLILIGMPGAGKSTVGVVLAKSMGYHFLDSDLVIQEREGKLLHELISENGTKGFLAIEERINASIEAEIPSLLPGEAQFTGGKQWSTFRKRAKSYICLFLMRN